MVSNDNIGQAKRISYQIGTNKVDQTSAPMEHLYLKNAVGCTVYKDIKSCQSLANLCVLNLYNEQSLPCILFNQKSIIERPLGTQEYGNINNFL